MHGIIRIPGSEKYYIIDIIQTTVLYGKLRKRFMGRGKGASLAWFFLVPIAAAFLAMNFTGATTYTSLPLCQKRDEMGCAYGNCCQR